MRGIKFLLLTVLLAVFVIGCGDKSDAPEEFKAAKKATTVSKTIEKAKATVASKVEKGIKKAVDEASSIKVSKSKKVLDKVGVAYSYDPVNKPDPFKQFKVDEYEGDLNEENLLLKYEVRSFRLVGVTLDEEEPKALFEDPNGHAYIIRIGDRIGRGGGVVQSITKDTVIVVETRISPRFEEGTETVQIPIQLHPDEQRSGSGKKASGASAVNY